MSRFSPHSEQGLAKVVLAVTASATMVFLAAMLLPAMQASAAVTFAAEGTVDGSTAAESVTENSFKVSCDEIPPTQGIDAYIFQLPAAGNGEVAKATPLSNDGPGDPNINMAFYGADCVERTPRAESDEVTETAPLPAGTKFVVAIVVQDMAPVQNTNVCLTVGNARCPSASGSPSASVSASTSASSSASASASATKSASASASHSSSPSGSTSSGPSTISTTIESNRSTVKYNKKFTLSGHVTAGPACQEPFQVTVRQRVAGSNTSKVVESGIPVDSDGIWALATKSKVSATYLATATASNSSTCESGAESSTNVAVRVAISVDFGGACNAPQQVVGRVKPSYPKTKVQLKRKSGRKFKTVDSDKLNKRSSYDMTSPSCDGKFQVVWPSQDPRNASGKRSFQF
jgi:hypothetical protein